MWKWVNVPIPVHYLLGMILGVILQIVLKQRLLMELRIGGAIGLLLIAVGVGLAAWSVLEAGNTEIQSPNRLLTGGPYSLSRNPMYIAWTLMYLGIGLAAYSLWIIALLPIVMVFTHYVDVLLEERFLTEQFGDEYLQFKGQACRYF